MFLKIFLERNYLKEKYLEKNKINENIVFQEYVYINNRKIFSNKFENI